MHEASIRLFKLTRIRRESCAQRGDNSHKATRVPLESVLSRFIVTSNSIFSSKVSGIKLRAARRHLSAHGIPSSTLAPDSIMLLTEDSVRFGRFLLSLGASVCGSIRHFFSSLFGRLVLASTICDVRQFVRRGCGWVRLDVGDWFDWVIHVSLLSVFASSSGMRRKRRLDGRERTVPLLAPKCVSVAQDLR